MKKLRRAVLWFQARSLEITIDGMNECLECIRDPYLTNRIIVAQINARNELRKVRREIQSLKTVSHSDKWRIAA